MLLIPYEKPQNNPPYYIGKHRIICTRTYTSDWCFPCSNWLEFTLAQPAFLAGPHTLIVYNTHKTPFLTFLLAHVPI
jgi:hypothetical protein